MLKVPRLLYYLRHSFLQPKPTGATFTVLCIMGQEHTMAHCVLECSSSCPKAGWPCALQQPLLQAVGAQGTPRSMPACRHCHNQHLVKTFDGDAMIFAGGFMPTLRDYSSGLPDVLPVREVITVSNLCS